MKLIACLLFIVLFFSPGFTFADHSFAPANYYPISGSVREGSIITVKQGKYTLSNAPNDLSVIGAITAHPAITQKFTGTVPFYAVTTSGIGYVLVSASNGPIRKGDYITTSSIPGVGQKAAAFDNTIGIAEDSYNGDKNAIGKIPVMINIRRGQIGGIFENGIESVRKFISNGISPWTILKFSLAGTIVLASIELSFRILGRTSIKHTRTKSRRQFPDKTGLFTTAYHVALVMCILYAGFTAAAILIGLLR